ncbi:MAG: DNA-directed RNA polymerase subunit omega [Planctomycetota bacterium]|nr:DNA-directed RNA polymerase subunit omega [Planctomycetota bacterium]
MIEALKSDELVYKVGGRFKLTALIMKRWGELLEGARPFVDRSEGMTDMEVVIQEILEDKIAIDYENSDVPPPEKIIRIPDRE